MSARIMPVGLAGTSLGPLGGKLGVPAGPGGSLLARIGLDRSRAMRLLVLWLAVRGVPCLHVGRLAEWVANRWPGLLAHRWPRGAGAFLAVGNSWPSGLPGLSRRVIAGILLQVGALGTGRLLLWCDFHSWFWQSCFWQSCFWRHR